MQKLETETKKYVWIFVFPLGNSPKVSIRRNTVTYILPHFLGPEKGAFRNEKENEGEERKGKIFRITVSLRIYVSFLLQARQK